MVKGNYFEYKFNDRYTKYSHNTENTNVLQVVYNKASKKYQILEKKFIDKVPTLISDYYTIYTKNNISLNLLYTEPRIKDITVANPTVHRYSAFFERLKAITYRCRNRTDAMDFTYKGGILNRSLFGIIRDHKRILSLTTDMAGTGYLRMANETFLVSKNILKPSKDNKRTIFGDFVIESQTSNVYKAYINSFSDFKADGVNGKLAILYWRN